MPEILNSANDIISFNTQNPSAAEKAQNLILVVTDQGPKLAIDLPEDEVKASLEKEGLKIKKIIPETDEKNSPQNSTTPTNNIGAEANASQEGQSQEVTSTEENEANNEQQQQQESVETVLSINTLLNL